jgi:Nucleotidyl transferase AbiEii toxin, Type IV TA system
MDDVARLSARDRADLFNAVAGKRGNMRAEIVEKDFWVCWTLKRLFRLEAPPAGLIFKGGTSLSKVYGAIDRFSEDVDLSFERGALGWTSPRKVDRELRFILAVRIPPGRRTPATSVGDCCCRRPRCIRRSPHELASASRRRRKRG